MRRWCEFTHSWCCDVVAQSHNSIETIKWTRQICINLSTISCPKPAPSCQLEIGQEKRIGEISLYDLPNGCYHFSIKLFYFHLGSWIFRLKKKTKCFDKKQKPNQTNFHYLRRWLEWKLSISFSRWTISPKKISKMSR